MEEMQIKKKHIPEWIADMNTKERDKNIIKIENKARDKGWCSGKPIYKFLSEIDYHIWKTHNDQMMINEAFVNGFNDKLEDLCDECKSKLTNKHL